MKRDGRFQPTRWPVVKAAGGDDSTVARDALGQLYEAYYHPLYAHVRRDGYHAADAEDLTQSFWEKFIAHHDVRRVRQEGGRFRSYLLTCLDNFVNEDRAQKRTLKRGGGQPTEPLRFEDAEERYLQEPADTETPATIFERRYAFMIMEKVMDRLRADLAREGKGAEFDALRAYLPGGRAIPPGGYKALAAKLDSTEDAR
jgi:RNA polymerase sigma-70 factor (ECF subfamily)